jgi:hypothetical protein
MLHPRSRPLLAYRRTRPETSRLTRADRGEYRPAAQRVMTLARVPGSMHLGSWGDGSGDWPGNAIAR